MSYITLTCDHADGHYYTGNTVIFTVTNNFPVAKNVSITYWRLKDNVTGTIVTNLTCPANGISTCSWTIPGTWADLFSTDEETQQCAINYSYASASGGTTSGVLTLTLQRAPVRIPPTIEPTIVDINETTIALTGNSNKLVRYFSTAQITPNVTTYDGAVGTGITVYNGLSLMVSSDNVNEVFTMPSVISDEFDFVVTDSYGFETKETVVVEEFIDYSKLSCALVEAALSSTGTLTFKAQGNYYNDSFGAVDNALTLEYQIDNSGTWIPVTATINGYNYTFYGELDGFNYLERVTVQVRATDKLMSVASASQTVIGVTIFDWSEKDFNFNVPVSMQKSLSLGEDALISGHSGRNLLQDTGEDIYVGYGSYTDETGSTKIYGNNIDLIAANDITVNGKSLLADPSNVLWEGEHLMGSGATIYLSDSISNQSRGIVLVFSLVRDGVVEDVSITTAFVSKKEVALLPGAPHTFLMAINAGLSSFGAKYLYIGDTTIGGHEGNTMGGTAASGITFTNYEYVLRYVIGV